MIYNKKGINIRDLHVVENDYNSRDTTPGLDDLMNDPVQALTKGWSFLSVGMEELGKVAVEGVKIAAQGAGQFSRYANENYVKPAQSQWNDPNFRNNVNNYVQSFTAAPSSKNGFQSRNNGFNNSNHTQNEGTDDFFNSTINSLQQQDKPSSPVVSRTASPANVAKSRPAKKAAKKSDSDDDGWGAW
jgi:hypothetical protein